MKNPHWYLDESCSLRGIICLHTVFFKYLGNSCENAGTAVIALSLYNISWTQEKYKTFLRLNFSISFATSLTETLQNFKSLTIILNFDS